MALRAEDVRQDTGARSKPFTLAKRAVVLTALNEATLHGWRPTQVAVQDALAEPRNHPDGIVVVVVVVEVVVVVVVVVRVVVVLVRVVVVLVVVVVVVVDVVGSAVVDVVVVVITDSQGKRKPNTRGQIYTQHHRIRHCTSSYHHSSCHLLWRTRTPR